MLSLCLSSRSCAIDNTGTSFEAEGSDRFSRGLFMGKDTVVVDTGELVGGAIDATYESYLLVYSRLGSLSKPGHGSDNSGQTERVVAM